MKNFIIFLFFIIILGCKKKSDSSQVTTSTTTGTPNPIYNYTMNTYLWAPGFQLYSQINKGAHLAVENIHFKTGDTVTVKYIRDSISGNGSNNSNSLTIVWKCDSPNPIYTGTVYYAGGCKCNTTFTQIAK